MPEPARTNEKCLYIVAVPIGNIDDITVRGLNVLKTADAVICEEARSGSTLLKKLGIERQDIILLNEHNERQAAADIVQRIHERGHSLALISDCGTPVFSDPGHYLVKLAVESGVRVVPVPGASSLMAALSVLDVDLKNFVFGGFLPRDKDERRRELQRLRALNMPVVLMDTPYRLLRLLQDVASVFGEGQQVTLACDLTLPSEIIYRGSLQSVMKKLVKAKPEFILVLHSPQALRQPRHIRRFPPSA